jgi:hypothetical protein
VKKKKKGHQILYFLAVRFLGAARVVVGCGAVVLVIRPDLVFPRILGCSTIAGALECSSVNGQLWTLNIRIQLTVTEVLRALPELALGLVAVFLAAVFLGVAVFATAFLGAAFLAAGLYYD